MCLLTKVHGYFAYFPMSVFTWKVTWNNNEILWKKLKESIKTLWLMESFAILYKEFLVSLTHNHNIREVKVVKPPSPYTRIKVLSELGERRSRC